MNRIFNCKYGECMQFKNKQTYDEFYDEWMKLNRDESSPIIGDRIPGYYFEIDSPFHIFDSFKLWWVGLKSNPFTSTK